MVDNSRYINPDVKLFEQASKAIKEVSAKFPLARTESSEKNRRKIWGQANDDEGLHALFIFLII
jgi:hypothetical protein